MEDKSECIFCKNLYGTTVIKENGYNGIKCTQCGLIYISPRPSFNDIFDLYNHDNANISAESHLSADYLKRLYARHNLRVMRTYVKRGTVLEIGAGAGYFLDEARKLGFDTFGIEFNPIQASHIRDQLNIPCEESPLSTSMYEGMKFDIVYHCDVISHFSDPISEFKKINEATKEGSFHIFETGNLGDVDPKYFNLIDKFQYPDHLFFYSTNNIKYLLEQTGFKVIKIQRYSLLPQMIITRYLKKVFNIVFKHDELVKKNTKLSNNSYQNITQPVLKHYGKVLWYYLIYLLRYKTRYFVPCCINMPQTILVIAQKQN